MRLALCLSLALAAPVGAQTLGGLTLGAPIPEGLPAPLGTMIEPPDAFTRWSLEGGLELSSTADAETGTIHYIEMWREGQRGTAPAPVDAMTFGQTTLDDLTSRFGSDGILFGTRDRFTVFGDVVAYFTSYEIAGTDGVVTFVTLQPIDEAAPETMGESVLDAISLSTGTALDQVWGGNRGRSEGYERIADPFIE